MKSTPTINSDTGEENPDATTVRVTETEPMATDTKSQHLTSAKLYSVVLAVSLSGFLMSLDISIIATAIPSISSQFHRTADIGWYSAAYPLSVCALQPFSGKLATIFSLRWVFQAFFATFLFGSLLCGVATSSNMFIVGRAIAGMGGAGLSSGAMSIITMVSPPKERALWTGLFLGLFSLSFVVGPVIGGALTQNVSWRWCFYMNLPAGAVTIGILLAFLHPPTTDKEPLPLGRRIGQLDLFGCFLFAGSIIMLFLAMQWGGNEYAWNSATVIGLFVGFGCTFIVFIYWQYRRGDDAMLPFSLMRRRSLSLSIIYCSFLGGASTVPVYYLPEWFQIIKGVGPTQSGIQMLPFVATQMLGMVMTGAICRKSKYYNPFFMVGSAILCLAGGLFTTFTAFTTPDSHWVSFEVIQGLGTGIAMQMPLLMVPIILKEKPVDIPLAISLVLFAQFFGISMFQTIAAAVFKNKLVKSLESVAGLDAAQVKELLIAGNTAIRSVANKSFPDKLRVVLEAYNDAITQVFWLELAGALVAFCVCFGIEWMDTSEKEVPKTQEEGAQLEDLAEKV